MAAWLVFGLLILSSIILVLRHSIGTVAGMDAGILAAMITGLALLIYVLYSFIADYRRYFVNTVQHIIIGAIIAVMVFAAYIYRSELLFVAHQVGTQIQYVGTHVSDSIQKTLPASKNAQQFVVRIRKRYDGHFVARANINDIPLNFIIDTGATTVVLRYRDAQIIGIDVSKLKFNRPVRTANGQAFAAYINLKNIAIGPLRAENVDTFVVRPGALQQSLLGMSFLNRLKSFEFTENFLTIRG